MKDFRERVVRPSDFWDIVEHPWRYRMGVPPKRRKKKKKVWKKSEPVEMSFQVEVQEYSEKRMIIQPKFKILKRGETR